MNNMFQLFKRSVKNCKETDTTSRRRITSSMKWCRTDITVLEESEEKLLSYIRSPYVAKYIEVTGCINETESCRVRTLIINEETQHFESVPLVLLHGLGAAIGLWLLNLDDLGEYRRLYVCDLLGFGLSSRPSFSKKATEVTEQYVKSIELWRQNLQLEKFILLGHSMGGYLATAYAIKYPNYILHLILAEPWGFPDKDRVLERVQFPVWTKFAMSVVSYFNPFVGLRIAGPWGPRLVEKLRPDISERFGNVLQDFREITKYIFHCNAQTPTGEDAFKSLSEGFGWAKEPMMPKIKMLRKDVPITFLYGSRSWMDSRTGYQIKKIRKKSDVKVYVIHGAGHHLNADQSNVFNSIVNHICKEVDRRFTVKLIMNDLVLKTCKTDA